MGGGLKHLAAFSKLSVLGLTDCNITDDDVKELVALPWDNLESIWISYNKIGIKGVNCFISHKWPKLVSLHFSNSLFIKVVILFMMMDSRHCCNLIGQD